MSPFRRVFPSVHSPRESEEQRLFCRAAATREWGKFFFHVPNERWLKAEAFRMKREGVKAGIPDIWVMWTSVHGTMRLPGMVVELKRQHAVASSVRPEQVEWLNIIEDCGFVCAVARGAHDAVLLVDAYVNDRLLLKELVQRERFVLGSGRVYVHHQRLIIPEEWAKSKVFLFRG